MHQVRDTWISATFWVTHLVPGFFILDKHDQTNANSAPRFEVLAILLCIHWQVLNLHLDKMLLFSALALWKRCNLQIMNLQKTSCKNHKIKWKSRNNLKNHYDTIFFDKETSRKRFSRKEKCFCWYLFHELLHALHPFVLVPAVTRIRQPWKKFGKTFDWVGEKLHQSPSFCLKKKQRRNISSHTNSQANIRARGMGHGYQRLRDANDWKVCKPERSNSATHTRTPAPVFCSNCASHSYLIVLSRVPQEHFAGDFRTCRKNNRHVFMSVVYMVQPEISGKPILY